MSRRVDGELLVGHDEPPSDLVAALSARARQLGAAPALTFLADRDQGKATVSYAGLDARARAIAAALQNRGLQGCRALLLFEPGLDYVACFLGCVYGGVIAVPVYPPSPSRIERTLPRLLAIADDADADAILTTTAIQALSGFVEGTGSKIATIPWIAIDAIADDEARAWTRPAIGPQTTALLQYTSGSTSMPKGVILSHANLLSNLTSIQRAFAVDENSSGVIWLPPYHDMGLIGGILDSLFTGIHSTLMSPLAFLQKPIRWLQAISATRATISGGPNFAYDLCARKVRDDELATLDLSCWRLAFNGAETIRVDTMDRFAQRFAVCGFRKEAFYPCYGLAEATLLVTGNPPGRVPTTTTWSKKGLAADVARSPDGDEDAVVLVGCGEAAVDRVVTIVEPKTGRPCADRHIGEIWVQGPAVSEGYWNNPEGTQQSFRQKLHDGSGSYLRTGDLGFVDDGQLYVTGRQKDLIVLRGRNVFPQDIERTTENAHPAVRPGCVAAFAVEMNQEERLVVVAEVERRSGRERRTETRPADDRRSLPLHPGHEAQPEEPFSVTNTEDTLLTALAQEHQVDVGALVLIMPGTLPKTSSGKVQRHAARQAFLDGTLTLIGKENV